VLYSGHWLDFNWRERSVTDYKVIVVGTDGSETSLRAVDEAAAIAAKSGAKLIVASAYQDAGSRGGGVDPDQASGEGYRTEGNAPLYAMLRDASSRAKQAGAGDIEEKAVEGAPVDALLKLADEAGADLIVVGSVGLNSVVGRLIGSVPRAVRHRAKTEVLVVDTK
jgi:nucleotide-binding universal stress UspA family protein